MGACTQQRILVIRRDNIGDLVCTTPLLRALRRQLPDARIEVLVTRYNRAVLDNNPDIDAVHSYIKAKHREADESVVSIYWERLRMLLGLRRNRFDVAIIAGGHSASAMRFAHWVRPRRVVVLDEDAAAPGPHEVEKCCHLLTSLGHAYETPAPRVVAREDAVAALRGQLGIAAGTPVLAIHISARKPSQRWPAERFAQLMRRLHATSSLSHFMLLWAPGSESNPMHPGDDEKAEVVLNMTKDLPIHPVPTQRLEDLIAALGACDRLICADGGAMHLGAGLGKPILCFFGQSDAERWHPWGVPYELLQPESRDVADISVEDALAAFNRLAARDMTIA
ncbi:MAG: hypothetical protein H6R10_1622 [Rhodocyclaceae bacterium]|nr:hypothetical protein [Rhodocyclaceae bacterium]